MDHEGEGNANRSLFVVAMDAEWAALSQALGPSKSMAFGPARSRLRAHIWQSEGGQELWAIQSGIGLVRAGVALAFALEAAEFSLVVSTGVAGGLATELEVGDVVIGKNLFQHDSFFSGEEPWPSMAPGEPYLSLTPEQRTTPQFDLSLPSFSLSDAKVGTILSGSEFVGSLKRKLELVARFPDALAVDMESAGLALVCRNAGVPFAVVRTIADRLRPDDSMAHAYRVFLPVAAQRAAQLAARALGRSGDGS